MRYGTGLALCLALWAITGAAQDLAYAPIEPTLDKIVVLSYRNRTQIDSLDVLEDRIGMAISNKLLSTGKVLIAGRIEVAAAMDTLVPGQDYLTNERQAYSLGRAVAARKVVFGSFTMVGNTLNIKTYMVDCEAMTVHTVEQAEPTLDLASGQVAVETARVVQGQIVGITPRDTIQPVAAERKPKGGGSSPAAHPGPWVSLAATMGLGYLTLHYDGKLSDTWDDYLGAVDEHEITRLYNKSSDYLLARNALAVLTLGSAAAAVYYWFTNDYGGSEHWAAGTPIQKGWTAGPLVNPSGWGITFSRRF